MAAARLTTPGAAPPLYDGVVISEPYRWVIPPAGGAAAPGIFDGTEAVEAGASRAFAAATSETPPQAQLLAPADAFAVPAGTSELHVTITPLAPPAGAAIVGNAYRLTVTGAGDSVVPVRPGAVVTIVLRAPAGTEDARIVELDASGSTTAIASAASGQPDGYVATVSALGTFAIAGTAGGARVDQVLVTLGCIAAVGLGGLLLLWRRERVGRSQATAGRRARATDRRGRR